MGICIRNQLFASFVMINQRQVKGMDTETRLLFTSFFAAIAICFFQTPEIVWNGTLFGEGLWIYGLILGLFGIVIPIYLFSIAVPKVGTGDDIHFKCNGTSSSRYRIRYFIE